VARIDLGTSETAHYYIPDHLDSATVIASEAARVKARPDLVGQTTTSGDQKVSVLPSVLHVLKKAAK
jgi:hypothetical protein